MNATTTRKLTRFQYAATLLGALAFVAVAPGIAHATNDNDTAGPGGCHYTDADGYDIPIFDGEAVKVDGKTVSCSGGTITVSAVKSGANLHQQAGNQVLSPVTDSPSTPPRVIRTAPVTTAR